MTSRWPSHALVPLTLALLTAAISCKGRHEPLPESVDAGLPTAQAAALSPGDAGLVLPPEQPYPLKFHYLGLAGSEDFRNRYSAAVEVGTFEPEEAGIHGMCSGVLLSPRMVLTAGHCVCRRRPAPSPEAGKQFIIDGTSCAKAPRVTTLIWDPSEDGNFLPSSSTLQTYTGIEVRPHPEFQIRLNTEGLVEFSHADLALIILEASVEAKYSPLPFAQEGVRPGETFVLVGGTADEAQGSIGQQRRFMRYHVTGEPISAGSDRVFFEQPQRALFKGDSGGPCIREGPHGPLLLGISGRGLGHEAAFTSIHPYRSWLRSALRSERAQ